jgi:hypothetical protein
MNGARGARPPGGGPGGRGDQLEDAGRGRVRGPGEAISVPNFPTPCI